MITLFLLNLSGDNRFRRGWSSLVARLRCIVPGASLSGTTLPKSTFSPPWLGSPAPLGKAASAYVNAKIIIKLISNVGKAGGSLQTNQFLGPGRFAWILRKGITSIRFGRSPLFLLFFLLSCSYTKVMIIWTKICFSSIEKKGKKPNSTRRFRIIIWKTFHVQTLSIFAFFFFLPSIKKHNHLVPKIVGSLGYYGRVVGEFRKVINNDPDTGKLLKVAFATR